MTTTRISSRVWAANPQLEPGHFGHRVCPVSALRCAPLLSRDRQSCPAGICCSREALLCAARTTGRARQVRLPHQHVDTVDRSNRTEPAILGRAERSWRKVQMKHSPARGSLSTKMNPPLCFTVPYPIASRVPVAAADLLAS